MRLLHALTFEFESFEEDAAPNYAILSHTWGDDEVTYKDMKKHRKKAKSKAGYEKIERCAALAVRENLRHIWIDTCCIDKSSSAELSEAINSMFRWYRNAAVCFVHLADVQAPLRNIYHKKMAADFLFHDEWAADFRASRWFTRGWTLQELIAPKLLVFYSDQWVRIGTKWDLESQITARTFIPGEVLTTGRFDQASVAQRMSWASSRTTSRKEDMAYCLMGLFEVNMPLLYGEGKRAFTRLQEEIIKRSDDMSIFGWTDPEAHFSSYQGLFAESPSNFTDCAQMEWSRPKRSDPFELTNKGIKLNTELAPIDLPNHVPVEMTQEFVMRLPGVSIPNQAQVTVRLQRTGEDEYARVETKFLPSHRKNKRLKPHQSDQTEFFPQTIFVRETPNMRGISIFRVAGIRVKIRESHPVNLSAVAPEYYWDASENILTFHRALLYSFPPKASFTFKSGESTIDLDMDLSLGWESIFGTLPDPGPDSKDSWVFEAEAHQLKLRVGEEPLRLTAYRSLVGGNAWVILEVHDPPGAYIDFFGPCI